jgi:very-short-patch-repair endonuclease
MIHDMRRDAYYQALARDNRRFMTAAETLLWSRLRAHRMVGHKFRRQHAIGRYIVDFVCLQSRLVIEVDGGTHAEPSREALDEERTAFLERLGFRVRRFWNDDIFTNLEGIGEAIFEELEGGGDPGLRPSPQPSPRWGEGVASEALAAPPAKLPAGEAQ